jgi:hypothetical protein
LFLFADTTENGVVCIDSDLDSNGKFRGITHLLSSVFLPQGYPSSVSDDYLEYQIWDTIQVFHYSLKAIEGQADSSSYVYMLTNEIVI